MFPPEGSGVIIRKWALSPPFIALLISVIYIIYQPVVLCSPPPKLSPMILYLGSYISHTSPNSQPREVKLVFLTRFLCHHNHSLTGGPKFVFCAYSSFERRLKLPWDYSRCPGPFCFLCRLSTKKYGRVEANPLAPGRGHFYGKTSPAQPCYTALYLYHEPAVYNTVMLWSCCSKIQVL
jgi:hypothetical protein